MDIIHNVPLLYHKALEDQGANVGTLLWERLIARNCPDFYKTYSYVDPVSKRLVDLAQTVLDPNSPSTRRPLWEIKWETFVNKRDRLSTEAGLEQYLRTADNGKPHPIVNKYYSGVPQGRLVQAIRDMLQQTIDAGYSIPTLPPYLHDILIEPLMDKSHNLNTP